MKKIVACIYARQSRDAGRNQRAAEASSKYGAESISIRQQVQDAQRLAKEKGFQLDEKHIFVDANLSGKLMPTCWGTPRTKTRLGLSELIKAIERGELNVVLIRKRDRLARNTALSIRLYEFFRQHKVGLFCTHESIACGTAESGESFQRIR